MALHDFIKKAGLKTEKQFYDKYPTEEAFFKDFPEMKYGGKLNLNSLMDDLPKADSGIHIKKSHKGLFTKKANKHDMGVQEFAHYVKSHKDKFNTSTEKQATFAINAKSWGQNGLEINPSKYDPNLYTNPKPIDYNPSLNLQTPSFDTTQGWEDYDKARSLVPINNLDSSPTGTAQLAGGMGYAQRRVDRGDFLPEKKKPNIDANDVTHAIMAGLSIANRLIPEDQYEPMNVLPTEYNAHPYGTGSSALFEDGGAISDGEYDLTPAQIKALKAQGYEIEEI